MLNSLFFDGHIDLNEFGGEDIRGHNPPQPAKKHRLVAPYPRLGLSAYGLYSRLRLARQVTTNRRFLIGCTMGKPENHGFRRKSAGV